MRRQVVQGNVQLEHVDAGFAQDAKRPAVGGLGHFRLHRIKAEIALLGYARGLQLGIPHGNVRVEPAAARGHGIPRNQGIGSQAIFSPIGLYALFHGVDQLLGSRTEVGAAGACGVIAIGTGGGGPGMEIFRPGKILTEPFRADDPSVSAFDEASVGLAGKEELAGAEDDQRKDSAEQHGEEECRTDRSEDFFEDGVHGFFQLGEMQGGNNEIDQLNADERHDDAAQAVDEQVALQDFRGAKRAEFHPL